jgi:hypothetical protein
MQPTLSQQDSPEQQIVEQIIELTKKLQASQKRLRDLRVRHFILLLLFIASLGFSIHMSRTSTKLMSRATGDLKTVVDTLNRETKFTAGLRDILLHEFHVDCKMTDDGMASCDMSKKKSTPPAPPAAPILPPQNNDPTT